MSNSQLRINDPLEMKIIKKVLADFLKSPEVDKHPLPVQMRSIYLYQKVVGLIHTKPSSK